MKIDSINSAEDKRKNIVLKGKRVFQNTVKQLAKNNKYSLTEPNQRLIRNAITELGKVKGSKNIEFLMNTAAQSTYSTNIELQDKPKNNWKEMLLSAAAAAVALTTGIAQNEFIEKIANLGKKAPLTEEEQEIMGLRDQLLNKVDLKQIKADTSGTMKDFKKNLDYFIVSSETTLEHKKYVLERLNFFMSNEYEINPQLEDKKHIVLAEMVNDMAIDVPGNKIPNIKAVNQQHHGICAAISISRKKLAYEDKPNYVDNILSELDSSNQIMVYDRSKLGSGEKIPVEKVEIDFETALARGYRIIDTSAMHWMHIASMAGNSTLAFQNYKPFDKENFGLFKDVFSFAKFEDESLSKTQEHFQALKQAESVIKSYKKFKETRKTNMLDFYSKGSERTQTEAKILETLKEKLTKLNPAITIQQAREILGDLFELEQDTTNKIAKNNKYIFLDNEEDSEKLKKLENYLRDKLSLEDIDDKVIADIYEIVSYYNQLSSKPYNMDKDTSIRKNRMLYEAGGAFRTAVVKGLETKPALEGMMRAEGLPNKETLVVDTIDRAIQLLEKNSPHSELVIEQLSPLFDDNNILSKEEMITSLNDLKDAINDILNDGLDQIYSSITLGDKKTALMLVINNFFNAIEGPDNKKALELIADIFGVRATEKSVTKELQKAASKIMQEGNDGYLEIFHKIGAISQMEYVGDLFSKFVNKITEQPHTEEEAMATQQLLISFLEANGLTEIEDENAFANRLKELEENINGMYSFIQTCAENLKVVDDNGGLILSANPKDIIIKRLENKKQIPAEQALRALQEHFDKVDREIAVNSTKGHYYHISDKSLYEFSKQEKEILKQIDKSINPMSAYIHKQIEAIRHSDFNKKMEELGQIIGKNNGDFFVVEGHGGLDKANEIRVLEYMTGRPHQVVTDQAKAIEIIKTTPYSGVSSSHVYHTTASGHSQYIADIEPVKVKIKDENGQEKEVEKEILWHDNTWGPVEKENTWVDSQGFTRTDYTVNRGGTLGYLVNDKYRNGNFVDRIVNDMVVAKHHMPQYFGFALDGKSPKATYIAHDLYEIMYEPNTEKFEDLTKVVKNLTEDEIKAMITKAEKLKIHWVNEYNELRNRIFGDKFISAISTQEDYDKLADNDRLKVILEKIAFAHNGYFYPRKTEFFLAENVKELEKFRKSAKTVALNDFKYAFGKLDSMVEYLGEKYDLKQAEGIEKLLKDKYNIELTEEQSAEIGTGFGIPEDWDGSVKSAINSMMEDLGKEVDSVIENPDARDDVKKYLRNFLESNLYFNKEDMEKTGMKNIIKFIDRVYDPENDEELVQVFRNIQDMTKEEFKREILSKLTLKDLGLKSLTGFDVLKKIKMYDKNFTSSFKNMIINSSLKGEINFTEENLKYAYTKFSRIPVLTPKKKSRYDFGGLYTNVLNDILTLSNEKFFNVYKDVNQKEGAYTAFPNFDYVSDERVKATFDPTTTLIETNIATITGIKNQIESYGINEKLQKYARKFSSDSIPSDYQFKNINILAGKLVSSTNVPPLAQKAAEDILEIPQGSTWSNYLPLINTINSVITEVAQTSPANLLGEEISRLTKEIAENQRVLTNVFVQKRYQNNFNITMNKYEQALIKQEYEKALELKVSLYEDFKEHYILKNPQNLLEAYLKSCAKDSRTKELNEYFNTLMGVALAYAQIGEIEETIMEALESGVELSVKTALKDFKLKRKDGIESSMDSPEMVASMANSMIVDKKIDTPLLFLEKFGFNDTYVEYMAKNLDLDAAKKMIDSNYKLVTNFGDFEKVAGAEINDAIDKLNNGEEYVSTLNILKKQLKSAGRKYKVSQREIKILLSAIDNTINFCENDKNLQVSLVFNSLINNAKATVAKQIKEKYDENESYLGTIEVLMNLISTVMLMDGSSANTARAELCDKYRQLAEYREQLSANLPEA